MSRRSERNKAFEILFEKTFVSNSVHDGLSLYTLSLVNGVEENINKIDDLIKANIINWKFERISRVAKCALRLGIYEILQGDIPSAVAINESVEIAKVYATEDDANYVQAVLSSVLRQIEEKENI